MSATASRNWKKQAAESMIYAFDFQDRLDGVDTLTGTPTVTGSPSGLTIDPPVLNTSETTIRGETIPANQGVLVRISSGTSGEDYRIECVCGTTNGDTLKGDQLLRVRDE